MSVCAWYGNLPIGCRSGGVHTFLELAVIPLREGEEDYAWRPSTVLRSLPVLEAAVGRQRTSLRGASLSGICGPLAIAVPFLSQCPNPVICPLSDRKIL